MKRSLNKVLVTLCSLLAVIDFCFAALRKFFEIQMKQIIILEYLAPSIQVCPRSSPNLSDCLKYAVENLRPLLRDGQIAPGFITEGEIV